MQTLKLRLVIADVPMLIEAHLHWSTTTSYGRRSLERVRLRSVRVTEKNADIVDLLVGDTARWIEDTARRWALTRDRLDNFLVVEPENKVEVSHV